VLLKIAESRKLTKEEQERLQLLLACMRMICDSPYILDKECRDCPKLEQRIARAWRKHQKRNVRVLNLVTADSIEERMIEKLAYKSALADSVLDGADFQEARDGKPGRESFIKRLRDVMGEPKLEGQAAPSNSRPPSSGKPSPPSPGKTSLADALLSRHGDRVRGIEQSQSGVTVVVAEPGDGRRDLEDTARRSTSDPVEVISTETLSAPRRIRPGALEISRGRTQRRQSPHRPRHDRTGRPHLNTALEKAKEALSIYFTSTPEGEVDDAADIPQDEKNHFSEIDTLLNQSPELEQCRKGLRLCDQVVRIIST
jgi:hypothetical protein